MKSFLRYTARTMMISALKLHINPIHIDTKQEKHHMSYRHRRIMAYQNSNTCFEKSFWPQLPIGGTHRHNNMFNVTSMVVFTIKNDKLGSVHHMAQRALFPIRNLCALASSIDLPMTDDRDPTTFVNLRLQNTRYEERRYAKTKQILPFTKMGQNIA